MVMTLGETITRLGFIASIKEARKQDIEAKETLQLMSWLIELKDFKEKEKIKLELLNRIIENKNAEIENQELRIEKLEKEIEELRNNNEIEKR